MIHEYYTVNLGYKDLEHGAWDCPSMSYSCISDMLLSAFGLRSFDKDITQLAVL